MFRRFAPTGGTRPRRMVITVALAMLASGLATSPAWAAAPGNDNFADAQVLSGPLPITTTGTNVDATKEPGEPDHAGNPGGGSVWYTWTATNSSSVTFDTCESDFDTLLAVYTGDSIGSLTLEADNDDGCGFLQSSVSFSAKRGTTYRIAADGYDGERGPFRLTVSRTDRSNRGPHQETVHIDDTYIDSNATLFCGFLVEAHDVGTLQTGSFAKDRFIEAYHLTTTYTNLDTGLSVEVHSSARFTDTSIDNLDPNFTGTYTELTSFTGLNYRMTGNGAAVSAGEGSVTVTYTFREGIITRIDVDETSSPHLEHLTAIICQALSGATLGKASISGTVRDDVTGAPLDSMCVSAYDTSGRLTTTTLSQNDGSYRLRFLTAGQYTLRFDDCNTGAYLTEWYRDQPDQASATMVTVRSTGQVKNVDALLQAGGVIRGKIANEAGEPLRRMIAQACDPTSETFFCKDDRTDLFGNYEILGLPAGQYEVYFYDPNVESIYVDQWYDHVASQDDATLVPAAPGSVTSGIDATLAVGGTLSGRVTDTSGQPASSVCVYAAPIDPSLSGEQAFTDSEGRYRVAGMSAGTYKIEFSDCGDGTLLAEWYDDQPDFDSADPVSVTLGADTGGIDAVLALGGAITGHVTVPSGRADLVCVEATSTNPNDFTSYFTTTDEQGNYRIGSLPTGDYKVKFSGCFLNGPRYRDQWWNNRPDETSADIIHVSAPGTVSGIDAHMTLP
jgi:hypothetical protein